MDNDLFRTTCQALFGDEWHRAAARGLGEFHPDGPRPQIDDRLVRRWAAGDRDIPLWVRKALYELAMREHEHHAMAARRLHEAAERLLEPAPVATAQAAAAGSSTS